MTLYLSRLTVNAGGDPNRPRPGRMWISNPYRVHQRLCMAFPDGPPADECRTRDRPHSLLFRIEDGPVLRVLAQSTTAPDWKAAFDSADFLLAAPPEIKSFEIDFHPGDRFRFLVRVNPTIKRKCPDRSNGVRIAIRDHEARKTWFRRKAADAAFEPEWDALRVVSRGDQVSRRSKMKDRKPHTHHAVDFTGFLRVREPEIFLEALLSGIGSAKAYGFGLLSLARA